MDADALFAEFLGEIKSVAVAPAAEGGENVDDDAASVGENEAAAAAALEGKAGGANGVDTNKRKGNAAVSPAHYGVSVASKHNETI